MPSSIQVDALALLLGLRSGNSELLVVGKQVWTASDFLDHVRRCSTILVQYSGARVIVPTHGPYEAMVGMAACKVAGATAVFWRRDAIELAALAHLTRACALLKLDALRGEFQLERLLDVDAQTSGLPPGDIVLPTSGSTGMPKGVAFDLEQAAANAALAGSELGLAPLTFWALDGDVSTVSALSHVLMAWRYDKPAYHLKGLDWPERDHLFASAQGGYGGAPLQLRELSSRLRKGIPAVLVSSGDFLMPAMADAVLSKLPNVKLHKLYGLTEVAGRFCILPHEQRKNRPEAAGRPMPGFSVQIGNGERQGEGEILIASPFLFHGYWREREGFVPRLPGLFRTGDLGAVDEQHVVTLLGRTNDVFKVGGEKVDRYSIERVLQPLFGSVDYCVLPVPHAVLGFTPALFVASSGAKGLPSRAKVIATVKGILPARYAPTMMLGVDGSLPRLSSGKMDRQRLLRDLPTMRDYAGSEGESYVDQAPEKVD